MTVLVKVVKSNIDYQNIEREILNKRASVKKKHPPLNKNKQSLPLELFDC